MKKRISKFAFLFCLPVVVFLTLGIFLVNGFASGFVSAVSGNGGGLFVGLSATASIQSGMTIKGSSATNGGGVYISSGGTLNMTGGTVSGNSASENGNNIYNAGTFTMTGGTVQSVSSNKAVRVDANGNPSSTGNYVLFGSYPQSHQTDTSVITSSKDSNGYYLGTDGNRYAKMVATIDNKFQDGTTVTKGSTYYFKVEPIKWRILNSTSGTLMLLCDQIMDSKWWDDDVSYTNSYVSSEIRAFLNGYSTSYGSSYLNNGFLQNAFTEKEQSYIQTTTVDNSVSTMNDSSVLTSETNTNDKIFLLSYKDLTNTSYGFSSSTDSGPSREVLSTDFARAVGSYASSDYTAGSAWWSRSRANYSAESNSTNYATMVTYQGFVVFMPVNKVLGVVPVLNLSTSAFDMEEYGIYNTGTMNLYGGTINDNVYSSTSFNTKMNATINGTITLGDSATITVKDYAGTTPTLNIVVSSSRANGTILTLQGSSTAPDLTNLSITGYDSSKFKVSSSQNSSGEWEITLSQNQYKVSISFVTNSGIMSYSGAGTYEVGSTVHITAGVSSGYSWNYWSGFPDDVEFVSGYSKYSQECYFIMPEKSISLIPYGSANVYTITLDNQSATTTGTLKIYEKYKNGYYSSSSATSSTSITSITKPTKTNYAFGGYYTSTDGSGTQIIDSTGSISASNTYFTSNTTLYARWIPNTYTITLNNQSATSAGTSTIYEKYGVGYYSNSSATTSITSITIPTKTGYTFGGYYTSTGGSGTQIIDSSGLITATSTKFTVSTTLYAKWTLAIYTITLNNQSATSAGTTTIYEKYGVGYYSNSGATTSITSIIVPTKTGYTFGGYYTSTGGSGTQIITSTGSISASNTKFTSNTTLYAKWTATSSAIYTITLNNQGATTSGTSTIYEKYGVGYYSNSTATSSITSITVPTKSGYTFGGYYTSTSGSGIRIINSTGSIEAINTYFTSATTIYAYWIDDVELGNEAFEVYLEDWLDNIEDYFNGEGGYSMSDVKTFAIVSPYGGNSMYDNYVNHIDTDIMYNVGYDIYFGYCESNDAYSFDVIYCIYCPSDLGFDLSSYVNTTFLMKFENLEVVDFSGLGVSSPCSFRIPQYVSQVYTNPSNNIGFVKHIESPFEVYKHDGDFISSKSIYYIPNDAPFVISSFSNSVLRDVEVMTGEYGVSTEGIVFASMVCPELYEDYIIEPIYRIQGELYLALFTPTTKFFDRFYYDESFYGFYVRNGLLWFDFDGYCATENAMIYPFTVSDFRGIEREYSGYTIYPEDYPDFFGTELVIGSQFANVYAGNLVDYSDGFNVLSLSLQSAEPVSANLEINNQIQAVLDDEKKRYFVLKEQNLDDDLADDDKND